MSRHSQWTEKEQRQFDQLKQTELDRGATAQEAEEMATRTVNEQRPGEGRSEPAGRSTPDRKEQRQHEYDYEQKRDHPDQPTSKPGSSAASGRGGQHSGRPGSSTSGGANPSSPQRKK